ncbi:DUF5683 domain-containing protein [Leptospira sp. WS92.C1]
MFSKNYFYFFLFLLPSFLFGETIIFKDGSILKGKISSQNAQSVTIKTEDGKLQEISKVRVLKVVYKNVSQEEAQKIKKEEEAKLLIQEQKKKEKEDQKKIEEQLVQKNKEEKEKQSRSEEEVKKANTNQKEQERLSRIQQKGMNPWDVTRRSAVLPGWGQWTDERKVPAIVFSSLFVSALYWIHRENQIYRKSVKDLNHINNPYETFLPVPTFGDPITLYLYSKPFEDQRERVSQNYQNLQLSIGFAILVYAANIFDAYFFHPLLTKSTSSHLIFDYNPMVRLESSAPPSSNTSGGSLEGFWKLGICFSLE